MKSTVTFAVKGPEIAGNANKLLPDKDVLFSKLGERGLTPVVSAEAESAYDQNGVYAHTLEAEATLRPLGHVAMDQIGAVINLLDRSFKDPTMPAAWGEAAIPRINENAMRSLAFRKADMQERVLERLGLGIPTLLVTPETDIAAFTGRYPTEHYVAKPNSGTFSRGIRFLSSEELAAAPIEDFLAKPTILQPKYDFAAGFDAGIRPYDEESREAFEGWSQSDATKEIRNYAFLGPSGVETFPVARAMHEGTDHWFFVDPDSVPEKIHRDTIDIAELAARETGSRALYLAADFGYGSSEIAPDVAHTVVEVNGKMPYLIGSDKHAGVANVLRDRYAGMIEDVVRNT